jgi:hypothetical protein
MDNFVFSNDEPPIITLLWNVATLLVMIGAVILGIVFLNIFSNPASRYNPYPPPAAPTLLRFPTATITPRSLPATWTPSPTLAPSETPTPRPTFTLEPTFTPFILTQQRDTPTATRTATRTPMATATTSAMPATPTVTTNPGGMPFDAKVDYLASTVYYPASGCNWFGVAGQVVDQNNTPILYLTVYLGGQVGSQVVGIPALSATAPIYGPSGFEFVLGNKPVASTQTLWIQLLDQQQLPFSNRIYLDTFDDCTKNLILVRFKKVQ